MFPFSSIVIILCCFFSLANAFTSIRSDITVNPLETCDISKTADEYTDLGTDYSNRGLYFLAIDSFTCAIRIEPTRMKLYLDRSTMRLVVGQYERAISDAKHVTDAEPDNDSSHFLLSLIYFDQEKYSDALAETKIILEKNNEQPFPYFLRGKIYVELNDKTQALEALNEYVRLQKYSVSLAEGYAEIAFAYEHFGDMIAAIPYFKKATELVPEIGTVYLSQAQKYRAASNLKKALRSLDRAIRLTPSLVSAYSERAGVYIDLKILSRALEDCDKVIQLQPQKPDGYTCQGVVDIKLGKTTQAIEDFNHAIALDKHFISAYRGRAITALNTGDYSSALLDIEFAIKSEQLNGTNYQIRAQIHTASANVTEAIADYETYLSLHGGADANPSIIEEIQRLKEKIANL